MPHRDRIRARLAAERSERAVRLHDHPWHRGPGLDWMLFVGGAFVIALGITVLWFSSRQVLDIGGFCAEGGPFVIEDPCPGATAWVTPVAVLGGMVGAAAMIFGAAGIHHSAIGLVLIAWPALFLSLAFNFLQYGLAPPEGSLSIGWLISGLVFVTLGLPVAGWVRGTIRDLEGPRRALLGALAGAAAAGLALGILLDATLTG